MVKICDEDIAGRKIPISVDERGWFSGFDQSARTKDEVVDKIRRALQKQKVRVTIPVTILDQVFFNPQYGQGHWRAGVGVRHVTLTGVHAGNHSILAKDDQTGKTDQMDRFESGRNVVRRLTPDEAAQYEVLRIAVDKAQEALHAFVDPLRVNAAKLVEAALVEAQQPDEQPA